MFERVGMHDNIEGAIRVRQRMHVYFRIGGESVLRHSLQDAVQASGLIDLQHMKLFGLGRATEKRPPRSASELRE